MNALAEFVFPSLQSDRVTLVLGLGQTGIAAAMWCARMGVPFRVLDTREQPPGQAQLRKMVDSGQAEVRFGAGCLVEANLEAAGTIVVSPGVSPNEPGVAAFLQMARARNLEVISEIELFARSLHDMSKQGYEPKVLAITGTNGKTTVTAMVRHLLEAAGLSAEAVGNIGPAALTGLSDALVRHQLPDVWVLELSSFQLASTYSLKPDAAVVLNISQDHLDWHGSFDAYAQAKARLLKLATVAIVSRDDVTVREMVPDVGARLVCSFGTERPYFAGDLGLETEHGMSWLLAAEHDDFDSPGQPKRRKATESVERKPGSIRRLMPVDALKVRGLHNAMNAMAALLLARSLEVSWATLLHAVRDYPGEPNRTEFIRSVAGVDFINDSKGTNIGATVAALEGLGQPVVLIAGGLGKGQDFARLATAVQQRAVAVVLIGQDATVIKQALTHASVPTQMADSMDEAVVKAMTLAQPGQAVLLSPACASMDMFDSYVHRARVFVDAVNTLALDHGEVA